MSKFTAFPVNGDAFLLEREKYSVLVDGGGSKSKLVNSYKKAQGKQLPNYIVCTHRDSDHINGLIGLLEEAVKPPVWNTKNTELWVPFYFSFYAEDYAWYIDELSKIHKEKSISNLTCLEHTEPSEYFSSPSLQKFYAYLTAANPSASETRSFFTIVKDEIGKATRYKSLLDAAAALSLKLRFFEYSPLYANGGEANRLYPLNSHEIQAYPRPTSILQLMKLSLENLHSLAFISPETQCSSAHHAVIFCADTDLTKCNLSLVGNESFTFFKHQPLITAPHHGSSTNQKSYTFIHQAFLYYEKKFFIRGHCSRVKYIAHEFKGGHSRACTKPHNSCKNKHCPSSCRCKLTAEQTVILQTSNGVWQPSNTHALI